MTFEGVNLIASKKIIGTGTEIFGINPNTNEQLEPSYKEVSDSDFETAIQAAWQAFLEYRLLPNKERAIFLETIADNIEKLGDELIHKGVEETGLPHVRIEGERGRTCGQLRLFAHVLRDGTYQDIRHDEALPNREPLPRPELYSRKIGLGPVAIFGASNFPLAFSVAGGDTASALAAGCSVVVKAHQAHPGTSELVGKAIVAAVEQCNMPKGVFSLLYGQGSVIGQKLASHPYIKAIGFTGSRRAGVSLMTTAFNRSQPIPVYAEMSSINPVYIMPSALKNRGVEIGVSLVQSMMMGAGQFCTSPGLVFAIKDDGFDDFVKSAQQALQSQLTQTMLTKGIALAYRNGVAAIEALKGVTLLAKGQGSNKPNQCQASLFLVDANKFMQEETLKEEVFGASAVIICCDSLTQMQQLTESLDGQLTASIHCDAEADGKMVKPLLEQLERKVGRILFNGFGTGVEVSSAMVHGGPFPATSDGRSTSVGTAAIDRFLRPVCYQNAPSSMLPEALKENL